MKKDFLRKLHNAVSGRLLVLKKKVQACSRRLGTALRAAACRAREAGKESGKTFSFAAFLSGLGRIDRRTMKLAAIPLCLIAIVLTLMSGSLQTVAWFTDLAEERNSFEVGKMDMTVYYKNDIVTEYTEVTPTTNVFNDRALYEPGYTQVVYFRIENDGNVDFDYQISVTEAGYIDSKNVYNSDLHLADYLRFGVVTAESQPELDRALARALDDGTVEQDIHINGVYTERGLGTLEGGKEHYAALVVYMPEEVGNEANYRGVQPRTVLGITVYAQQAGTMQ